MSKSVALVQRVGHTRVKGTGVGEEKGEKHALEPKEDHGREEMAGADEAGHADAKSQQWDAPSAGKRSLNAAEKSGRHRYAAR